MERSRKDAWRGGVSVTDCLFCKIANKELAADIVFEDGTTLAFRDINPQAPVHLLIIPKKHIPSLSHLSPKTGNWWGISISWPKIWPPKRGLPKMATAWS